MIPIPVTGILIVQAAEAVVAAVPLNAPLLPGATDHLQSQKNNDTPTLLILHLNSSVRTLPPFALPAKALSTLQPCTSQPLPTLAALSVA